MRPNLKVAIALLFFLTDQFFLTPLTFAQGAPWYYPLAIGDLWQYWDPSEPPSMVHTVRSVGDTMMPNTLTYRILSSDLYGAELYYYRQFGSKVYQYVTSGDSLARGKEVLLYDFSKQFGDTVSVFWSQYGDTAVVTVLDTGSLNFYGVVRRYKTFYQRMEHITYYSMDKMVDSVGMAFKEIEPGQRYFITGAVIDGVKYGTVVNVGYPAATSPPQFALYQNYPNPFNGATIISYWIPSRQTVSLTIVDVLGRHIKTLVNETQPPGLHSIAWDGRDDIGGYTASGIYFCRYKSSSFSQVRKMIMVR